MTNTTKEPTTADSADIAILINNLRMMSEDKWDRGESTEEEAIRVIEILQARLAEAEHLLGAATGNVKTLRATIKAIRELSDKWLQQNSNTKSNWLTAIAEGAVASYDWREQIATREQCADELKSVIKEHNHD